MCISLKGHGGNCRLTGDYQDVYLIGGPAKAVSTSCFPRPSPLLGYLSQRCQTGRARASPCISTRPPLLNTALHRCPQLDLVSKRQRTSLVPLIHQLQRVNLLSPPRVGERWDLLHGLELIISPVQPSSFCSLRGSLRQAPGSEAHGTLLPPSLHTPLPLSRRSWLQFYFIFESKQNSRCYMLKFLEGVEENTGRFSTHHV